VFSPTTFDLGRELGLGSLRSGAVMSRKWKHYLGGGTVLSQHPGLRMRQMEVDAARAKKRAEAAQRQFDREQAETKAIRARLQAEEQARPIRKRFTTSSSARWLKRKQRYRVAPKAATQEHSFEVTVVDAKSNKTIRQVSIRRRRRV
jgi:hypothetical protein